MSGSARFPDALVESSMAAVQAVRSVVLRQLIALSVQYKSSARDAIGVAANGCAEIRHAGHIRFQGVKPQNDVFQIPGAIWSFQ